MFSTIGYYICIPFAWILRLFYNLTGSYGWALILFTLVVKLVLLPFQLKSKKSMMRMNRFQPKIKEIQTKYANNQAKMNEELQLLYAEEGVNPMSGCLWSFLPFPIIIALYSIIRQPLSRFMLLKADVIESIRTFAQTLGYVAEQSGGRASFYEEIHLAQFMSQNYDKFSGKFEGIFPMSYNFLGLDLTAIPQDAIKSITSGGWAAIGLVLIPVISAVLSYFQSKVSMAGTSNASANDAAGRSSRMMMWMMPVMSLWIGFTLPAALGVYWIANSFFMMIQDMFLNKYFTKEMDREETEREKQKREERVARMMAAREQQRQQQSQSAKQVKKQEKKADKKTEKKPEKKGNVTTENGRVGDRPYARGRSFSPDHYGD
ncbi:MAG: YidC/Oxa1 family membrane protein insertase [Oscillospiraceae bacterium]|jgi:YidC/Oxa1 family membrane protein insertase|nr:YidC/Oxa1 family membrane protein insertase [Oscillospiraceae bacterium]MBQ1742160.1 YidC/Oxa1 family membrane protein insertase [Oscillospiraceae bacterium]MBQ2178464.1 YidC/Oxa1 family membrane protein insertase [Oscillospiraceae bacterium]MBQ2323595.1 YidC/Oxa1 family membrane protein insertase [Oscillospiraceae bacterium]MBQ2607135.1 YidC/Oxa1 family membrane protein insertase [Oscillospiraceae bacterium]